MEYIKNLIDRFAKLDVLIFINNGQLKTRANKHVMTPELINLIKENKTQLIDYFSQGLDVKNDNTANIPLRPSGETALSFAQQRLWLMDQISDPGPHYNMPGLLTLSGPLNHEALRQSFSSIIERHESLRTRFALGKDGEPIQVVQINTSFTIPQIDLSNLDECERQQQLAILLPEEAGRSFNLSHDLMLRSVLIKTAIDEYLLLVTMHHIASDGWSLRILVNEFCKLYDAYRQGMTNPLPPLSIQYADYACWQRNWLQGEVLEEKLNYWVKQLAHLPLVHSLPLDHVRPSLQRFVGSTYSAPLETAIHIDLLQLCHSQGATLFMGLHAAFSVFLSRYSNEKDIVIGSPIANREQAEVADLIGFFVNTLVLRSDLSNNPCFATLISQSKEILLDAYAHQDVPFDKIVEQLQPERSLTHSPLFQVMLVLQNNAEGTLHIPGLKLSLMEQPVGVAKYDLTLFVSETKEGLQFNWEYSTDLFDASTIVRMAKHFNLLLHSLIKSPNESVFNLNMLSAQESNQLLVDWNNTTVNYPKDKCIHEMFESQVKQTPDAVAVIFEEQQLTYQQLNEKANQLAHYLIKEKQVALDSMVGICIERSLEMVIGILAILKAGCAYVPLDSEYPEIRLKYMLKDARLTVVLTQMHLRETTPVNDLQAVCLDSNELKLNLKSQPVSNPHLQELNSSHLAYVIYTSGSTGNPKGVMVEHSALVNRIDWMNSKYGLQSSDRILQKTPFSFDVSVWEFMWPLSVGAALVLAKPNGHKDPVYLSSLIRDQQITKLHFVPSMLASILSYGNLSDCVSLRQVFCSGEALAIHHVEEFHVVCPWAELHNLYGPTEAAIDVSYWNCLQSYDGLISVPIGRPINNIQLLVLNSQLIPAPQNVVGELHIGGVGLARGYLNRPDLTNEKFIHNPFYDKSNPASSERLYKTGDLARWLPDGNLEFLGRIDHQVKMRGFRIELGEIENTLREYKQVKDVVVIAKYISGSSDNQLVAYVVTDEITLDSIENDDLSIRHTFIDNLRQQLRESLPDYMVPSAFVLLNNLPLTSNGKIDRNSLPAPDLAQQQKIYEPPQTREEKILCEIWQEILGVERVGVTDDFFLLGGHSLLLVKLSAEIKKSFNQELMMRELFEHRTIQKLTKIINKQDYISAINFERITTRSAEQTEGIVL